MEKSPARHEPFTLEVWMRIRDLKKLKSLLVINEISHRQLAAALGWKSHGYVGKILRGQVKTVSPEVAVLIAHRLNLDVEDLFVTEVTTSTGQNAEQAAA